MSDTVTITLDRKNVEKLVTLAEMEPAHHEDAEQRFGYAVFTGERDA